MKTSKKTPAPTMKLDRGIGFDPTRSTSGYGLENNPAAVIFRHPIDGMRFHGPFVNADARWLLRQCPRLDDSCRDVRGSGHLQLTPEPAPSPAWAAPSRRPPWPPCVRTRRTPD